MSKKNFIEPEIEVIDFDEDVIATSGDIGGGTTPYEQTGFDGIEIPVFG